MEKKCRRCGCEITPEISIFTKNSKEGIESQCKPCARERAKEWYQKNKIKKKKYDKEYVKRKGRSYYRAVNKKWRNNHPAEKAAETIARRTCLQQATPKWADKKIMNSIYKNAKDTNKHVDHIVPLRGEFVSGLHCEDNLQILDPHENISKGNKYDHYEWPYR